MKDFSYWCEYEGASEGSGRSEKIWLINPDNGQTGLFKFKKDVETTDHISECIAFKLACILNIPCARFDLGIYNGKVGSMSYNIVNREGMRFQEGIHFLNLIYPYYDPDQLMDTESGNRYSVEMIFKALKEYKGVFDKFIEILIFDFLIGNSDRHQSNWALIYELGYWNLSPLYDNSSSLCAYESGKKLGAYLGKDNLLWRSLVDTRSKSIIRIRETDNKVPSHLEVITYLADEYSDIVYQMALRIKESITSDVIDEVLLEYNETELSNIKKQVIKKFVLSKVSMLINIVERKEE
jgi:hypothetical protein